MYFCYFSLKWIDDGDVLVDVNGDEGKRIEEYCDGLEECNYGIYCFFEWLFIED